MLVSVSAMKRFHSDSIRTENKKVSIGTVTSSSELCLSTIKQLELHRPEDSP